MKRSIVGHDSSPAAGFQTRFCAPLTIALALLFTPTPSPALNSGTAGPILATHANLERMVLSDVFLALGEPGFTQLLRTVSIGKLKTYQLYERVKLRFHLGKLNSESLRKAAPRLWSRIAVDRDEEFTTDVAQMILVSHLDMITAVLNFLEIPNEDGFFSRDLDPAGKLTEGWQQRVWDNFHGQYADVLLLFYINHLDWELTKSGNIFKPAEVVAG